MHKLKEIILSILFLTVFVSIIITNNYFEISDFFSKFSDSKTIVSCVEFSSNNKKLTPLINKVNYFKKKRLKNLNLECSTNETIKFDCNYNTPPTASSIWSFYQELKNSNTIDITLPEFLDEYFKSSIGDENCKIIINEIKGWINDPQITPDIIARINSAF